MKTIAFAVVIVSLILIISIYFVTAPNGRIDPVLNPIVINNTTTVLTYQLPNQTIINIYRLTLLNASCPINGIDAQCDAYFSLQELSNPQIITQLGLPLPSINSTPFLHVTSGYKPSSSNVLAPMKKTLKENITISHIRKVNITGNLSSYLPNNTILKNGKAFKIEINNSSAMNLTDFYTTTFLPDIIHGNTYGFNFLNTSSNGFGFNLTDNNLNFHNRHYGISNSFNLFNKMFSMNSQGNITYNNSIAEMYGKYVENGKVYNISNLSNFSLGSLNIINQSNNFFINRTYSTFSLENITKTVFENVNWNALDPPTQILRIEANYTRLFGNAKTVWQPSLFGVEIPIDPVFAPTGLSYYVPLNISNSQSTATPNPFQQMINITSSDSGWTYINNTGNHFGQNVEFFYANGTIIPSWLENYTSGHALWWVKVGSIAANSKLTIYMGFANKTTNLLNNKTTGEAPQLSSTYAEYDDGANVFLNYFSGNSLTGWTTAGTSGQTSTAPSGSPFGTNALYSLAGTGNYMYTTATGQSTNMIIEYYTYINSLDDVFFLASSAGAGQLARQGDGAGWYGLASTASWTSWDAPPDTGSWSGEWVLSGVIVNNSIATQYLSTNLDGYGSEFYQNPSNSYTVANNGNYLGLVADGGTGDKYWNGVIIRALPPNGVMPSVSFGSVQSTVAITLYLNGVSNANTTITYGTESNFTAERASSYISIYVNGTKVVSLTQNKAVYLKTLAAGLYKVTAVTNTSGVSNQTYYEKINPATPSLSITSSPGNFTYNGTKMTITGSISTLNSQLSATFSVNSNTIGTTTTSLSYSNATAGTYTAKISTNGNQNYTSASLTKTFQISKATPTLTLTPLPPINYTYNGTKETFTGSVTTVNNQVSANLYINGKQSINPYSDASAGIYKAVYNTSGNENYTSASVSKEIIISKAVPSIQLYLNSKDSNVTAYYGNLTNVTGIISTVSNQLKAETSYYSNVSSTSIPISSFYIKNTSLLNLSARRIYYYTVSTDGNQNYTSLSKTLQETIKPGNTSLIASVTPTIIYGNYTNITVTANNDQLVQLDSVSHSLDPSFPPNVKYFTSLNITNNQNVSTPNPFQQMINISSSDNGWTYINDTGNHFGQNVEFFYYNGTIIPSWLENYTSTNATWWLKIATIPGGSSETVYIGFAPKSTNLFNTVNDGEAPQLSPTYGEYNNIADVMNTGLLYQFYQLNGGGIQSQATVYQAQLTPNSVFAYGSLTATAGPTLYQSALSGSSQDVNGATDPNVIINYQYSHSGGSAFPNPPISNPQYVIMKAIGFVLVNSPTTIYGLSDDGMGIGYSNGGGSLMPWLGGSSTSNNPNNIINAWVPEGATQYSGTITTDGSYRLEIDYTNQGGPGEDAVWSNTSVDYYSPSQPPNGVMPSVSFGSVQATMNLYINGIKDSNVTSSVDTPQNITATVSSGNYVGLNITDTITGNVLSKAPLTKNSVTYTNASLPTGIYKAVAWTNSSTETLTFYLKIISPIKEANHSLTYLAVLAAGNYTYQAYQPSTQNWTGQTLIFKQVIQKHPIINEILINNLNKSQNITYGKPTSLIALSTNTSAITLQEAENPSNYHLYNLIPENARLYINNTQNITYNLTKTFGVDLYSISMTGIANANFSIEPYKQANSTLTEKMNITKYPFVNVSLTYTKEPASYNQPISFYCSYTTNLTEPNTNVFNGEILNANAKEITNTTPQTISSPYNSSTNDYVAVQRFNVSALSTYCEAENQNFSVAKSQNITYNLTLQKIENATISSSILSNHNLTSQITVVTNTPYQSPVFECNSVLYPVNLVKLNVFQSSENVTSQGQYNCIWEVYNTYNVEVTHFVEASAVSPVISAIRQSNISSIDLSNTSVNTFYNNSILLKNLANESWNYSYPYNSKLSPVPYKINLYINGTYEKSYDNTSGIEYNLSIKPKSSENISLVYSYPNSTVIKIFPFENISYNDTFGNASFNSIGEYVNSTIYPRFLPNGTKLEILNSCDYLAGLIGKGNINGTNCIQHNLTLDYLKDITNVSFSWIRYNGTEVSYRNVTLTSDVLNKSLKGYEMYNITNLQKIPIKADLLAGLYSPKGWNQTDAALLVNKSRTYNSTAIGAGTRILKMNSSIFPTSNIYTFYRYYAYVLIPNATRPWISSNPITVSPPQKDFDYSYRGINNTIILDNKTESFSVSSSTLSSSFPAMPYLNGKELLQIEYSINNNGYNAPSTSIAFIGNQAVPIFYSYVIVMALFLIIMYLWEKGYIKKIVKDVKKVIK